MPSPKRLPVEVVEKARAVAAVSKQYTLAASPKAPATPAQPKQRPAREKVVAALRRLHPMD
ncbi:MAG: hypothetical protein IPJ65_23395 [Archangiaceae bacterium]|nr:hypothetical protein [Archangiaceae bacterium]